MLRRLHHERSHAFAVAMAGILAAFFPVVALAQTGGAVATLDEAKLQLDAQSDQWMLEHVAKWLRANGCVIGKDREQDFRDGVLGLVLENLQVPAELHAEVTPAADDRMERAGEAWEASGKTFEELGLFMSEDGETLRLDPC